MNFLKLSFFALLVVAMAACNKDDDNPPICTQSDWVGTYDGTIDCDGSTENVTIIIAASGTTALDISYSTSTSSTTYTEPLTPVNCDLDFTATDAGLTLTVDASLNGDNLTFKEAISGNISSICEITATRK